MFLSMFLSINRYESVFLYIDQSIDQFRSIKSESVKTRLGMRHGPVLSGDGSCDVPMTMRILEFDGDQQSAWVQGVK